MLKSYDEMRKIDISKYTEQRSGADYLNWAKCVDLLHENGAEVVYFTPVTTESGSSLIMSENSFTDKNGVTNRCYEVKVNIHIDDKVYTMQTPVTNGTNPVKDNSMSQIRVWTAQCRAFVKGVAIYTGLGFDLWLSEEAKQSKEDADKMIRHDIMKVQERVFETVTAIQKQKGYTLSDIAEKLHKTEDELKAYLGYYKILDAIEHNLDVLLRKND